MSTVGSADVQIFPTFKGFRAEVVGQVDSSAADAGGRFSGAFGKAAKGLGTALAVGIGAAIAGIAVVAGKGLSRALNLQDAEAQLRGLGHSAESVETIMGSALDSVRGTAFGLDAAATIAASSVAAGIAPGEALTRTLKLTADAATIAKVPLSEMGDMVNKVATSGKLSTEVLNQFHGRGVPLLQMVADEYGITSEAASEMVTKGEIDFAGFQRAIEAGVGGAALTSGETARGAWANVGAAWGRLGALFVGSAVDGAPGLFVAVAGAVDRLTEAVTPLAGSFSGALTPAIAALSGWIDGIDFDAVAARIVTAFAFISGAIGNIVAAFQSGDFSGLGASFGSISEIATPLIPVMIAVAGAIGGIAGTVGDLFAAGIPLLVPILESFTSILGWLGDNAQLITPIIGALSAGFLIYRAAQMASIGAAIVSLPLTALQIAADFARTRALVVNTNAMLANNVTQSAGTLARTPATASILANTAATIGSRIAQAAGAVAMGIATAAQWALNTAMSANPIAIVLIAIVALIAGLVWFFTQTEVGKAAWQSFVGFLGEAWENIKTFFSAGMQFVSGLWTAGWAAVGAVIDAVWGAIVLTVTTYINAVMLIINVVLTTIGSIWSAIWSGIASVIGAVWGGIVAVVTGYINVVMTIIRTVLAVIVAIFTGQWSSIGGIVSSAWDKIRGIVSGMVSGIQSAIGGVGDAIAGVKDRVLGVLSDAGSWLKDSGRAIIQGFIDGISGMLSNVGDAVGGVMDFVSGFFPNSPAKRGPLSGSGWRRIKSAGAAVMEEFGDGANGAMPGMNAKFAGLAVSPALSVRPAQAQSSSAQAAAALSGDVYNFNGQMGMLPADVANEFTKKKRRVNALNGVGSVGVA